MTAVPPSRWVRGYRPTPEDMQHISDEAFARVVAFLPENLLLLSDQSAIGTGTDESTFAAYQLAQGSVYLTCTSNGALNGQYPLSDRIVQTMSMVQASINAGTGLPGGSATIAWADDTGANHAFTSAQFTAFFAAVTSVRYHLLRVLSGAETAFPSTSLIIP